MDLVRHVRIGQPATVAREASELLVSLHPAQSMEMFGRVFDDTLDLFAGRMPGRRACNTPCHDLEHTLQALLAATRLLHGMQQSHCRLLYPQDNELLLVAALLHDAGYIQAESDGEGTGGKYATVHVQRGVDFARDYLPAQGLSGESIRSVESCSVNVKTCASTTIP